MRFLVDANLPPALVHFLEKDGHQAEHVVDVGLREAKDSPIWDYALEHGAVIISKDEDFRNDSAAFLTERHRLSGLGWEIRPNAHYCCGLQKFCRKSFSGWMLAKS